MKFLVVKMIYGVLFMNMLLKIQFPDKVKDIYEILPVFQILFCYYIVQFTFNILKNNKISTAKRYFE